MKNIIINNNIKIDIDNMDILLNVYPTIEKNAIMEKNGNIDIKDYSKNITCVSIIGINKGLSDKEKQDILKKLRNKKNVLDELDKTEEIYSIENNNIKDKRANKQIVFAIETDTNITEQRFVVEKINCYGYCGTYKNNKAFKIELNLDNIGWNSVERVKIYLSTLLSI